MTKQEIYLEQSNPMRQIRLEKVVLSCGATGQNLDKAKILLEILSHKKVQIAYSGPKTRIPNFGVKPKMALGAVVTLRKKEAVEILKQTLGAIDNVLRKKQISKNNFSFGIHEYIEIPGMEYKREIGIRGLNVTASFTRAGVRVKRKKIKAGIVPEKQNISREEIIEFMKKNFGTEFK